MDVSLHNHIKGVDNIKVQFRLIEETKSYAYGDIVKLKGDKLHQRDAIDMAKGGHLFAITEILADKYRVSPITSQMQQLKHFYGYPIKEWQKANLKKESYISLQSYGYIAEDKILAKTGELSEEDKQDLSVALKKAVKRRQIIEKI